METKTDIFIYDDVKKHLLKAAENYLSLYKKSSNELTDEEKIEIYHWAGCHIGFFLSWLINNDFQSDFFPKEAVEALRSKEITGIDILSDYCRGILSDNMVKSDILPFMNYFYNEKYFRKRYAYWIINVLNDLPLEFDWDWDDCQKYEQYLTRKYKLYKKNHRSEL